MLQLCLTDLIQQRGHLPQQAAASDFGRGSGGVQLGGQTSGQERQVPGEVLRSRGTSPSKSMHRSPAKSPIQTPNGSSHHGTAYSELVGGLNLSIALCNTLSPPVPPTNPQPSVHAPTTGAPLPEAQVAAGCSVCWVCDQ